MGKPAATGSVLPDLARIGGCGMVCTNGSFRRSMKLCGLRTAALLIVLLSLCPVAGAAQELEARRQQELARLLNREFSPVAADMNGWTDLHYAAVLDLPVLAKALLDAGASTNAPLNSDDQPLSDTVKRILRSAGKTNFENVRTLGQRPLHLAAREGSGAVSSLLIERGADVNARDRNKDGAYDWSPLHYAIWFDAPAVAALLIDAGSNVNAGNRHGMTPLHYASKKNSATAVRELIRNGAHVMAKTSAGWTPLHIAAEHNAADAAKLLIDKNVYLDSAASKSGGVTPLHIAAANDATDVVRLLIHHGADLLLQSDSGFPWDLAIEYSAQTSKEMMLGPALHVAAKRDRLEVARALLDHGADVDFLDIGGSRATPLHTAVKWGASPELIELLLERGAYVNAKDATGMTPLNLYVANDLLAGRRFEIGVLLRSYGSDMNPGESDWRGVFESKGTAIVCTHATDHALFASQGSVAAKNLQERINKRINSIPGEVLVSGLGKYRSVLCVAVNSSDRVDDPSDTGVSLRGTHTRRLWDGNGAAVLCAHVSENGQFHNDLAIATLELQTRINRKIRSVPGDLNVSDPVLSKYILCVAVNDISRFSYPADTKTESLDRSHTGDTWASKDAAIVCHHLSDRNLFSSSPNDWSMGLQEGINNKIMDFHAPTRRIVVSSPQLFENRQICVTIFRPKPSDSDH